MSSWLLLPYEFGDERGNGVRSARAREIGGRACEPRGSPFARGVAADDQDLRAPAPRRECRGGNQPAAVEVSVDDHHIGRAPADGRPLTQAAAPMPKPTPKVSSDAKTTKPPAQTPEADSAAAKKKKEPFWKRTYPSTPPPAQQ